MRALCCFGKRSVANNLGERIRATMILHGTLPRLKGFLSVQAPTMTMGTNVDFFASKAFSGRYWDLCAETTRGAKVDLFASRATGWWTLRELMCDNDHGNESLPFCVESIDWTLWEFLCRNNDRSES